MDLHIAKNAREEKLNARKQAQMSPDEIRQHMEMERLYRQQVLKEQPTIQIQGLRRPAKQDVQEVTHLRGLRPSSFFAIGRNDPCPCGSGKKYIRCCG